MIKQLKVISVTPRNQETAMPYLVEGTYIPEWAKTIDSNKEYLAHLWTKKPKIIVSHLDYNDDNVDLYGLKEGRTQLMWVEYDDVIQYFVKVKHLNLSSGIDLNSVYQTSVWRNKRFGKLPGFAQWVFFNVLFPINHNILSDQYQTTDGMNFWNHRVGEALKTHSYFVYALLTVKKSSKLVVEAAKQITKSSQLEDYYTEHPDTSGEKYRILITKEKLELEE